MEIKIRHNGNMCFMGMGEKNHWTMMDSPAMGGDNGASTPMELFLMSLGGCSGMDVVSILKKKKAHFESFEMAITGEKTDTYPSIFKSVNLIYKFRGENLDENAIRRAIELSQDKYCGVSAMFKSFAEFSWELQLNPDSGL